MSSVPTVQRIISQVMKEQGLNQSSLARKTGVHRNFLIDLLRGRVPRMLENSNFADEDPRYTRIAEKLGLDPEMFVALAKQEQQYRINHVRSGNNLNIIETRVEHTQRANTVQSLIVQAMAVQRLTQSAVARQAGVNRCFFIDLLKGNVKKIRKNCTFANEDPRYKKLAGVLGLDSEMFITLAMEEQREMLRSHKNTGATTLKVDTKTRINQAYSGGLIIKISSKTMALQNTVLTFDIPEGRVTVTLDLHKKT